jgi:hypothetical protein
MAQMEAPNFRWSALPSLELEWNLPVGVRISYRDKVY